MADAPTPLVEDSEWAEDTFDDLDEIPEDAASAFDMNAGLAEISKLDGAAEEQDGGDLEETDNDTPSISEGDFIDPLQHKIFVHLKQRIREACNTNSRSDSRKRALKWIFVPGDNEGHGDFNNACVSLGARPVVIRARVAHQLWKANIMLTAPLPFLSQPPPVSVMSEIETMIGPGLPADVARKVWYWPSIPATELRAAFGDVSKERYQSVLDGLTAEGYLAIASGRVYFISRNPSLLSKTARERFSFSATFFGE